MAESKRIEISDPDPFRNSHLISGQCNIDTVTELQRFIAREGMHGICPQPMFAEVSKHPATYFYGSYFTFLYSREPAQEFLDELEAICNCRDPNITFEKYRSE